MIDKYDGGTAKSTGDYIKTDVAKLKNYINNMPYPCQYYFGVIYETDCYCLNWLDKRSTNNWARGRVTELNAGYLNDEVVFEAEEINYSIGVEEVCYFNNYIITTSPDILKEIKGE